MVTSMTAAEEVDGWTYRCSSAVIRKHGPSMFLPHKKKCGNVWNLKRQEDE